MAAIDDWQKLVTLVAAVVAAGGTALNLWWQYKAKADKIKVGFDTMTPYLAPGYSLHVVSRADHAMVVTDFGFFDATGRLLSLPYLWQAEPEPHDEPVSIDGSSELAARNASIEVRGITLRDTQIGAFAITSSQPHRTLGFRFDVPWWRRCLLRLRIRWAPRLQ
jgi:hypothetical protein